MVTEKEKEKKERERGEASFTIPWGETFSAV